MIRAAISVAFGGAVLYAIGRYLGWVVSGAVIASCVGVAVVDLRQWRPL